MAIGPGAYDAEAEIIRERTRARGVLLIVIHGDRGNGFECHVTGEDAVLIPGALRRLADIIEGDLSAMAPGLTTTKLS